MVGMSSFSCKTKVVKLLGFTFESLQAHPLVLLLYLFIYCTFFGTIIYATYLTVVLNFSYRLVTNKAAVKSALVRKK